MVAGRVHLRLGQGRGAILGPRPSLLETSIPSPRLGIFHPSLYATGARVPSLGAAGRPVIHAAVLVQPAADSHTQSLHSAMTLRVQELGASCPPSLFCMLLAVAAPWPLSLCTPIPCHQCLGSAHTVTQQNFTGTVHCRCCCPAEQLHQAAAAAAARFVHVNWTLQSSMSRGRDDYKLPHWQ